MAPRVLIVEDDLFSRDIIAEDLARHGLENDGVSDLESAFAIIDSDGFEQYCGVLLDGIILARDVPFAPEAVSLSLISAILEKGFRGPIIAMSGLPELRDQMVTAGCTHQTEKWDVADLLVSLLNES